jgi:hypothetical protein
MFWFGVWNYVHFPVWIGITAIGPSVLNIIVLEGGILGDEIRWLLTGSITLALLGTGLLLFTLRGPKLERAYRSGSNLLFIIGAIVIAFGFLGGPLPPSKLLLSLIVLLIIPIFYSLYVGLSLPEDASNSNGETD